MNETIRKDIILVMKKTLDALESDNTPAKLKELSGHTVHNCSIFQDEYSISTAILIYSLSKIIERAGNRLDLNKVKLRIKVAVNNLERGKLDNYQFLIRKVFDVISKTDSKFKLYVQEVFTQACVKKGSSIYAHGISAAKTAQILGISPWELYEYLGATNISDVDVDISSVRKRLDFTRSLFS